MSTQDSECDFSYHKYELLPDDFGQYDLSFKIIVIYAINIFIIKYHLIDFFNIHFLLNKLKKL